MAVGWAELGITGMAGTEDQLFNKFQKFGEVFKVHGGFTVETEEHHTRYGEAFDGNEIVESEEIERHTLLVDVTSPDRNGIRRVYNIKEI